jgi:Peptidase A4 family
VSFKRSPLRAGITAAAFLLPALAPAAAATAAATPSVFAPMQHVAGSSSTPFFISHGGVHFADTTSTNWAGEAATGSNGAFTSVSTTFVQPKVTCSSGDTYSAFWVGLDGYSSDSVEQTGTEADCDGRTAEYSAWYEMYPADPVTYSKTVKPGDTIVETVSYASSNKYTLTLNDKTANWTETTTKTGSYDRSSAEVIAEAPYDGEVLPLADFGSVSFTSSTVNGSSLSSSDPTSINMESSSGALEATTNALSGGSFSITWNSK